MASGPPPSRPYAPPGSQRTWLDVVADPVRLAIIRALSETAEATASELARGGIASGTTLRRHLDALVSVGVVQRSSGETDGQRTGRPPVRFKLSAELRESVRAVFGAAS